MTTPDLREVIKARRLIMGSAANIRRKSGLSLADLAGAIGVAPSTIYRWEVGERTPRGELACRYAALLRELDTIR